MHQFGLFHFCRSCNLKLEHCAIMLASNLPCGQKLKITECTCMSTSCADDGKLLASRPLKP